MVTIISKGRQYSKPHYSPSAEQAFNSTQEFDEYCEKEGLVPAESKRNTDGGRVDNKDIEIRNGDEVWVKNQNTGVWEFRRKQVSPLFPKEDEDALRDSE